MLNNIFLFKGKNFLDLDCLNIYNYPEDIITIEDIDLISKIIYGHDHGKLIHEYRNGKNQLNNNQINDKKLIPYVIDNPVPQIINNLNIFTTCINDKIIMGLIFDEDDNPYDYKDLFEELLNELLNIEKICSFEEEIEIENLLLTMFIDIRRYGDEYIERHPEINFHFQEPFTKVFIFGIDNVGKTSLVRRIKTNQFDDNYFTPTKTFNIEYIQSDQKGLIALWDMPGQQNLRYNWLKGLQDSNVIVFMVDIANQVKFEDSKTEFWRIVNRYELQEIPLLILANKVDLLNQSVENNNIQYSKLKKEIVAYFDFKKIKNREWKLLFISVKTNYNINTVINSIFNLI